MNCPVCKDEVMIILELDEIEVDYCGACKGVWLDEGELELLLDDAEKKEELLASFTVVKNIAESKIACPVCQQSMEKIKIGEEKLIIDKCLANHGLWFDEGELEEIINLGTAADNNRILHLLRNIFNYRD